MAQFMPVTTGVMATAAQAAALLVGGWTLHYHWTRGRFRQRVIALIGKSKELSDNDQLLSLELANQAYELAASELGSSSLHASLLHLVRINYAASRFKEALSCLGKIEAAASDEKDLVLLRRARAEVIDAAEKSSKGHGLDGVGFLDKHINNLLGVA